MSRIVKALEKAAQIKKASTQVAVAAKVEAMRPLPTGQAFTVKPIVAAPVSAVRDLPGAQNMERLLETEPLMINNPLLACTSESDSPVCEEYNKLRAQIFKLTKNQGFQNTLMVTSTVDNEGKTLTAINLAIAIAKEYDHTVLLVDADLRRPSVHRYLDLKPEVGLIQCVKDRVPLQDALIKTGIGKLVVLPAGGMFSNPVEFLASNQMKALIHELKNKYPDRYIIFDTPPALNFADAQVLASAVDGVLFVAREGAASPAQIKKAISSLSDSNLLGIVYNDVFGQSRKKKYAYC
ncbi:MAG: XrtA-associated tyrosine autokinase [Geopsychrobacter sp.]|nr:XrtA-associated tyrosine autokinase [Geopsychrobacter sp.]